MFTEGASPSAATAAAAAAPAAAAATAAAAAAAAPVPASSTEPRAGRPCLLNSFWNSSWPRLMLEVEAFSGKRYAINRDLHTFTSQLNLSRFRR